MGKKLAPFIYDVGQTFIDEKRDIEILEKYYQQIDRERCTNNIKTYRCKCNRCGDTTIEITEGHLKQNRGCPTCHGKKVTKGINDISTTDPWMIPYFLNEKDIYVHTANSKDEVDMICPYCKRTQLYKISRLKRFHKLPCICSDGISFPEKFIICLLEQLHINYIYQLSKNNFKWCNNYKYDFYLVDFNIIIEANGLQHYENQTGYFENIEHIQRNDFKKKELAIKNNVKYYIELDCSESSKMFIKKSILNSDLPNIIDNICKIDWDECEKFAIKNIIKDVCDYKNNNTNATTSEISKYFPVTKGTIGKYLHIGTDMGWCYYNGNNKRIEIIKEGISIGIYNSAKELSADSLKTFGIFFSEELIRRNCRKENILYKGYKFQYVSY